MVGLDLDSDAPTVTINQAATQADPTTASPIRFTVTFSEAVAGFGAADVALSGTAGATTAVVTGGPTTFDVAVSGMTGGGTVVADVTAGAATDTAGNTSAASTSTDNSVTFAIAPTAAVTNGECSSSNAASGLVNVTITDPDSTTLGFELVSNSNTTLVPNANVVDRWLGREPHDHRHRRSQAQRHGDAHVRSQRRDVDRARSSSPCGSAPTPTKR